MSNDTKQIEALRDAAQVEKDFQETKHTDAANTLWLAACHTISNCDRAIAALPEEAANCKSRPHEKRIIEFVKVPFIEQKFVETRKCVCKFFRASGLKDIHV